MDDEAAIAEAIRQSLAIMPPSSQLQSTSGTHEVPKPKEIRKSIDGPVQLCCPITLQLFQDPVKTLHDQTYERAAIEDWLENNSTDPMTGDILKIKALFPNDEMKLRCAQYVLSKPPVTLSCGRGGRGAGRGVGRGGCGAGRGVGRGGRGVRGDMVAS